MRLAGVEIPNNKRGEIALTYIYGIGRYLAKDILNKTGVDNKRVADWTDDEINKISNYIMDNLRVEGTLRAEVNMNI